MRFFLWVFTLIAAIVAAVYFSDLNPDPITLRLSKQTSTDVTPTYLVLLCIAGGALTVVMLFGVREVRTLILNWRSREKRISRLLSSRDRALRWNRIASL